MNQLTNSEKKILEFIIAKVKEASLPVYGDNLHTHFKFNDIWYSFDNKDGNWEIEYTERIFNNFKIVIGKEENSMSLKYCECTIEALKTLVENIDDFIMLVKEKLYEAISEKKIEKIKEEEKQRKYGAIIDNIANKI